MWLWCLASFMLGLTCGVGLVVFLLLGAQMTAPSGED
jgi:hypothetical protein